MVGEAVSASKMTFGVSLRDIAKQRHQTLSDLVSSIKAEREQTNLSSAIRLFVLDFYRDQFESSVAQTQQFLPIKIIARPLESSVGLEMR